MKYSEFHRKTNPISAARLSESFKASSMEGSPGDPKVKITKDLKKQEATISTRERGNRSFEEAYNARGANFRDMDRDQYKEEVDKYNKSKETSFTYKKLDTLNNMPKIELMDENFGDIELSTDFSDVEEPSEVTNDSNKSKGYTYISKGSKRSKNKNKVCKNKNKGLFSTKFSNKC